MSPAKNAVGTYKEFARRGVVGPERILKTGWDGLAEILDAGGYARYDFSTAKKLLAIVDDLMRRYAGISTSCTCVIFAWRRGSTIVIEYK